jgi:hypothetical protein
MKASKSGHSIGEIENPLAPLRRRSLMNADHKYQMRRDRNARDFGFKFGAAFVILRSRQESLKDLAIGNAVFRRLHGEFVFGESPQFVSEG